MGLPALRRAMSLSGPRLPTLPLQQVGGYVGHTGRGANGAAKAARDPKRSSTLRVLWRDARVAPWRSNLPTDRPPRWCRRRTARGHASLNPAGVAAMRARGSYPCTHLAQGFRRELPGMETSPHPAQRTRCRRWSYRLRARLPARRRRHRLKAGGRHLSIRSVSGLDQGPQSRQRLGAAGA